jgi:murein DD-endopeptidase MepM/ murein hydrolase activator NlpD
MALSLLGGALSCALLASGALASNGVGGAGAPTETGAAEYGVPVVRRTVVRPVAGLLAVPASVVSGTTPKIVVRIDEPGVRHVTARVVVLRTPGNDPVARIALGRVGTGRSVRVPWPKGVALAAGSYLVRLHAKDPSNHVLERRAHAAGRATMTVTPVPVVATVTPPTLAPPTTAGVFPVAGAHTYGDTFGAPRKGYAHQGQDVLGAEGTPIVAPTSGTITVTSYQAGAAGYYVVEQATDGRSFFFAHCQQDSFGVAAGAVVAAGAPLCRLGHTGDASGPHLHFEIWEDGWRTGSASHPVDPLPQLQAWDR